MKLRKQPLDKLYITSKFGMRDLLGMWWHNGIDLRAVVGTPIYAVADGVVRVAKDGGGYGLYIVIDHGGWGTLYAHLSKFAVESGMKVKAGDLIGLSGNTSNVQVAPHLHFEIRLGSYDVFWDRSKENSSVFMRCIDPESYIIDLIEDSKMTVEQAKQIIKNEIGYDDNTMAYLSNYYKYSDAMLLKMAKALK